jgi:hypothetical protein
VTVRVEVWTVEPDRLVWLHLWEMQLKGKKEMPGLVQLSAPLVLLLRGDMSTPAPSWFTCSVVFEAVETASWGWGYLG